MVCYLGKIGGFLRFFILQKVLGNPQMFFLQGKGDTMNLWRMIEGGLA